MLNLEYQVRNCTISALKKTQLFLKPKIHATKKVKPIESLWNWSKDSRIGEKLNGCQKSTQSQTGN